MMTSTSVWQIGGALALILASAQGQAGKSKKAPEYPLYCAGIVVGMSTGADVRRMYGDGLFVSDEGHGGGRYYVDSRHRVTLHVEIGVDDYIESVSYGRGIHLPAPYRKTGQVPRKAICSRLTANEHTAVGIRLGDTVGSFLRQIGRPTRDHRGRGVRVLTYKGGEEEVPYTLFYQGEFRFVNGRLVSIDLYNGE